MLMDHIRPLNRILWKPNRRMCRHLGKLGLCRDKKNRLWSDSANYLYTRRLMRRLNLLTQMARKHFPRFLYNLKYNIIYENRFMEKTDIRKHYVLLRKAGYRWWRHTLLSEFLCTCYLIFYWANEQVIPENESLKKWIWQIRYGLVFQLTNERTETM